MTPAQPFESGEGFQFLTTEMIGDVCVVRFLDATPQLINQEALQFGEEMYRVVRNPSVFKVVFDMTNLKFVGSFFLGKLISVHWIMAEKKGMLILAELTEEVHEVFLHTRLDTVITICNTVDDAVKKLG
jgi:anti-anti-sigma factor